jgi:hypothetical protein
MKSNVGMADRIIRIILAAVIAALYVAGVISGWVAIVLGIIAIILFITGVLGICPLYALLHISTKKSES